MTLSELATLEKFSPDFPLPDLNNSLYFATHVVKEEGRVVAGAFIKLTSELILITNPELRSLERARLFDHMMQKALAELRKQGLDDAHVFVMGKDPEKTAKVLIKHYGFVSTTGIPLYKGDI